jgi:sporulation protein YabP
LDEFETGEKSHKIEILQREQVRLQGVVHVESFDDRQVVVETDMGIVSLAGEEFHITSLDLEKGFMIIEGMFLGLEYSGLDRSKARQKDKGFLQRLFR